MLLLSRRVDIGFFGLKGWKGGKGEREVFLRLHGIPARRNKKKMQENLVIYGEGCCEMLGPECSQARPPFSGTRGTCLPSTSRHSLLSVVQFDSPASAPRPPSMNRFLKPITICIISAKPTVISPITAFFARY